MGLRHERAAQSNEVHMDTCVMITHTPVTLYDGEMMTHVYNTADYVSTATLGKHNCTRTQTIAEAAVESETVRNMPTGCIQLVQATMHSNSTGVQIQCMHRMHSTQIH